MTPLAELLAARIAREGPIRFDEFMNAALYHPEHGYYRRASRSCAGQEAYTTHDPFGKHGDFYTAEQIQPVFGILIAQLIRRLAHGMGDPAGFTVVELGAGRGEMAEALAPWRYLPVEIDRGAMPERFRGVLFSNEFFDAQPVRVVKFADCAFREQRVTFSDGRFRWMSGEPIASGDDAHLRACYPPPEESRLYEISTLRDWMPRIASALDEGWVLTIDYGFTREESVRFPAGTLMSYRRHTALDDVLADPGGRDITAHVNFSEMMRVGEACGLATGSFETLASALLTAGEADQFAAALGSGEDEPRRRLQLKTLLFGMGESFRVLLQRRDSNRTGIPEK